MVSPSPSSLLRLAHGSGRVKRTLSPAAQVAVLLLLAGSVAAQPIVNPQARVSLGQPDLLSNILNQPGASVLFYPYDLALDSSGSPRRLFVADTFNSRILVYTCGEPSCTLTTGQSAVRVLGQPDFASFHSNGGLGGGVAADRMAFPRGVAVDASGRLYVADTDNSRILIFDDPMSDAVADAVLGQPNGTSATPGSTLSKMNRPEGVFVDATGVVWVADTGNHRILRFTSIATGAAADFAIGGSGPPSRTTLSSPRDVQIDLEGRLWVADSGYSRVLSYPPPLTAGRQADRVFGQAGSFTSGAANHGGLGTSSLAFPEKLHRDAAGRLWVADSGNNRVLQYDTPLADSVADRVYGQADRNQVPTFATGMHDAPDGFPNAAGMWGPRGLLIDDSGTLWVCDRDNSRLLGFATPLSAQTASAVVADVVIGKADFLGVFGNGPTATRMNNPTGVAVDRASIPNRVYVVDMGNNRVLGYASAEALSHGRPADVVLGQLDMASGAVNAGINGPLQNAVTATASRESFFFPTRVTVDAARRVYVADADNSRILVFENPFQTDSVADQVFGQASFTARNPAFPYGTATGLAKPSDVSIDSAGALWVADTLYHRVVRFSSPASQPATGGSADLILGRSSFSSSSTFPPYAPGCAADRMNQPVGVFAAPSGRVYVADAGNHRVLVFAPPFSNGMAAMAVIGQSSFTSCLANRGGAASAQTLNDPQAVFEDAVGNVLVADYGNHRLLVYRTPFGAGGDLVADQAVGQSDLSAVLVTSPGPHTLTNPSAIARDGSGRLYVADRENSRVLQYPASPDPFVQIDPLPDPIVVGDFLSISGAGFTAGTVLQLWVATSSGAQSYGPYTPFAWSPGYLIWFVDPAIRLGNGFGTLRVVNSDQGWISSNFVSQLLFGNPARGIPTVLEVGGVPLSPLDPTIPTAVVERHVLPGETITIGGEGFDRPLVNLFTASGNLGPLSPLSGGSVTSFQITIPGHAMPGPGSLQVVNWPYSGNVLSNATTVPVGPPIGITQVTQSGSTVTIRGTGFSPLTVINLFNRQGASVANLGGIDGSGAARIPLVFVDHTELRFQVPASAISGPSFAQLLNPPFIPLTSSGNDPDGAFSITVP